MSATILDTGPPGQGVPATGNRGRRRKTIDAGNDASNTRVARIGHQKQLTRFCLLVAVRQRRRP
jgi:hypothetical protein